MADRASKCVFIIREGFPGPVSQAWKGVAHIEIFTPTQERKIRYQFDKFCRKVLKNEVSSYYRDLSRLHNREVSLTDLSVTANLTVEDIGPNCLDAYPSEQHIFLTQGQVIPIKNDDLAKALAELPQDSRDIVLLSFFLDMKDIDISGKMGIPRSTINYQRNAAIRKLRKIMEGLRNGKGRK